MKTIIQTATNQLQESIDFYSKLNFTKVENQPNLITDGKVIIEINDHRFARVGVKIYRNSWTEIVEQLQKVTPVLKQENGYLLSDFSGVWIYLMEGDLALEMDLSAIEPSMLGAFSGVSLETIDIQESLKVWEILGFSKIMGEIEQNWVIYGNEEGMTVSFMGANSCPHLFFNPSLTYFNGANNLEIIQQIRDINIPIAEEISTFNKEGIVDNIIIRDSGGLGFFLFSD
jgi:hypothetical protein